MSVRPSTPADHASIADICRRTGAAGADATGLYGDDAALADVYATPYLHGPGGFCLVWEVAGEARGYVLGTDDTRAFQRWFIEQWWPAKAPGHAARGAADLALQAAAGDPHRLLIPELDAYPAHLHVDLLPDQQGRGAGRALIEAACALLAERGAPGVHLGVDPANAGARAFYPRVGFAPLPSDPGGGTFGRRLAAQPASPLAE